MLLKMPTSLPFLLAIVLIVRPGAAEISDEEVRKAIRGGIAHLQKNQKADGGWSEHPGYPGGMTALCTLALINAGVDIGAPEIQRALTNLRSLGQPQMVYSTALQTMVFCAAEPDTDQLLISRNVRWLEDIQIRDGPRAGAWRYSDRRGSGDNSNSQFALLALHEAQRIGVEVQEATWQRALGYWLRAQEADGSWAYFTGQPSTGSMTCAGIASVIISLGKVTEGDASLVNGRVNCCGPQSDIDAVDQGMRWLASKFSAARNPNPVAGQAWLYYYLYGVERVGRLTGRRFIGEHDWFREGAEFLVGQQNTLSGYWRGEFLAEQNSLVATSFALLFLSKGRRPVVMSQLHYGEGRNWNLHRSAVPHLTRRIEQRWRRDLTWQTIDLKAATRDDLLETPVLFLSGRDALQLSRQDKEKLRQYVHRGGFLFAEACCEGAEFDADFRALMKELFPDSRLRLLPPEHAIWYAEQKVDSAYLRPLYGIEACCRTSVVYCPQDLSCYWELSRPGRETSYPAAVRDEVEACLRIGENVITYATNRELKNKLERPALSGLATPEQPQRSVLYIPKLLYAGGGDDAPNALPNLLQFVAEKATMRVGVENRLITATDPTLFEYPVVFLHGRRAFRFTQAERTALSKYLSRGGLLFADAICGSPEFATAFRREIKLVLNGLPLNRVPASHPLFADDFHGFNLVQVTLRDPQMRSGDEPLRANLTKISPLLEAAELDDRLAVIFSPYDLSCALESSTSLECKGYIEQDAARIGLNVILFALQQ